MARKCRGAAGATGAGAGATGELALVSIGIEPIPGWDRIWSTGGSHMNGWCKGLSCLCIPGLDCPRAPGCKLAAAHGCWLVMASS